jgi:hypothetical protein
VDSPQPTIRELLNELVRRVEKLEENQAAIEGAINAFIVVFGIRRLPDEPRTGPAPAGRGVSEEKALGDVGE